MPRPKKEGQFFNCYIRQELWEELDRFSQESHIPKTTIVEDALEEYFKKKKNTTSDKEDNDKGGN